MVLENLAINLENKCKKQTISLPPIIHKLIWERPLIYVYELDI